ncbi:hypothetical protein [Microtetraspora malaysiensis]|uniref:WD40 repeat domain-containing protein n=1 Tax=Microtetraspora malaysiensis TaxID=161358 RepID=A0ABW6SMF0_9ACTN
MAQTGAVSGAEGRIEREAVDRVVAALTSGKSGLVLVVPEPAEVEGMGVTAVLAAALRKPEVIVCFPEGIDWATVSATTHPDQLAEELTEVMTGLFEDMEPYSGLDPDELLEAFGATPQDEEAGARLLEERIFRPSERLMVLDGPIAGAVVPMAFMWPGRTWLVTAGTAEEAPPFAITVPVGPMTPAESTALLRHDLPVLDEGTAARLAELTCGWPFAITLVRSAIIAQGDVGIVGRLPEGVYLADPDSRAALIGAVVDHSVGWLRTIDPAAAERFLDLGLFDERESIPIGVAAMLWCSDAGMTSDEINALIARLESLSLLRHDTDEQVLVLPSTVRAHVRGLLGEAGLDRARRRLIDADPGDILEVWGALPGTVAWTLRNIVSYQAAAGATEELAATVGDVTWLAGRLQLSGVEAVLGDLDKAGEREVELLRRTVATSAHLLETARDLGDAFPTLACRLHAVPGMAERARAWRHEIGGPWLESRWTPPDLPHPALVRTLDGGTGKLTDVAVAPDGTWVAASSENKRVLLWRPDGTQLDSLSGHELAVTAVAVSPDGTWLASASWDDSVRLWRADGNMIDVLDDHPESVSAVEIAPDGTWLVSSGQGFVRFWNADGTPRAAVDGLEGDRERIAIAPDGSWVAFAGFMAAELRNSDGTLRADLGSTDAVAIAPSGEWLATTDVRLRLLNPDGGLRAEFDDGMCHGGGLAISPGGSWLAVGEIDDNVVLRDVDGTILARLHGHTDDITAVEIAPDGTWLASSSDDRTVRIWDVGIALREDVPGRAGERRLYSVAVAPDGSWLATTGLCGLTLWNPDGSVRHQGPDLSGGSVAIAPDGTYLFTGDWDGTARLHDLDGTVRASRSMRRQPKIEAVTISPDGAWTAMAVGDRVRIATAGGRHVTTMKRHGDDVRALAIAPDASWLAVAAGSDVRRWDAKGHPLGPPMTAEALINALAIAPDGRSVAAATYGGVELFDLDGEQVWEAAYDGELTGVAFSPDGVHLATTAARGRLRVWEAATGRCLTMVFVDSTLEGCAWMPDGSGIYAAGTAGLFAFTFHR